jgi:DNA-binding NarL/FixJ family response regulator
MEAIHVIIADKSQLVRSGLTGFLYQTRYELNITEIADEKKLYSTLQKDHANFMFISGSFLIKCTSETIGLMGLKHHLHIFLINDNNFIIAENPIVFEAAIEPSDTEKIILAKINKIFEQLIKPTHFIAPSDDISPREKDVLKLVAHGMTNKEIAEKLFISTHTVITHRKNITAKLGIKTIAGLTVYAVINKLIAAEDIK